MRYYSVLLILLLFSTSGKPQIQTKNIFISGIAKNFNNEVEIEDFSENEDLKLPSSERSFLPDSNGHFSISFHIDKVNYFKIGRNVLYLSPGTSMTIYIDYNWPDSAKFTGGNSVENTYLKSIPFTFMGSFLEGGDNIKNSIKETINGILKYSEKRETTLLAFKNIPLEFKFLETARIKADIINSLNYINFYYPSIHNLQGDSLSAFQKQYQDSVVPYLKRLSKNYLNEKFLKLHVYRNILPFLMKYDSPSTKAIINITDWVEAKKLVHEIKSVTEKQNVLAFEKSANTIKTPEYRKTVLETFRQFLTFNGDDAIDFVMADSSSRPIQLNSFKGQVIYIDIWATWCGPCMAEKPFIDSLIKHYDGNPDIVIISLSIDGDKRAWIKHLNKENYQGKQFVVDRTKLDAYYVSEIPRTIIIDKNFRIAAMRGPMPSDNSIREIIDSVLKK